MNVTYFLLAVALIPLLVEQLPFRKHLIKFTIIFPNYIFLLFYLYGGFGFEIVPTNKWGGLLVTLVLGVFGIALAFNFGIIFLEED